MTLPSRRKVLLGGAALAALTVYGRTGIPLGRCDLGAPLPPVRGGLPTYNWKSSNTNRLRDSVARSLAGQSADHIVLGDSTSVGYVGSMDYPAAWPWVLRGLLSQHGVPLGGSGWVFPCNGAKFALDPRWTKTGSWVLDAGYLWSMTPGDKLTYVPDTPGGTFKVASLYGSGPFTVAEPGRDEVTVTPPPVTDGVPNVHIYTSAAPADSTGGIDITVTSAETTHILGAGMLGAPGLQIQNMSRIGQNAYQWPSFTSIPQRGWVVNRLGLAPDVVHIALGVNDIDYGRTPEETVGALTAIRNDWPDSDVILHAQAAPSPRASVDTPPSDATWIEFINRLHDLADVLDCPLVDWYEMVGGSYTVAKSFGLMGDRIHPNAVAEAKFARAVADAMASVAGLS